MLFRSEPSVCKKISGSPTNFLVIYVDDIQHIGKLVLMLHSVNDIYAYHKNFHEKDLG